MDESVFRKKSVEQLQKPEELNTYIKVVNPSVWVILVTIIILIAGFLYWAIFGKVETKVYANFDITNTQITCNDNLQYVEAGDDVYINGTSTKIKRIQNHVDHYDIELANEYPTGSYPAQIVIESSNAAYFIFN